MHTPIVVVWSWLGAVFMKRRDAICGHATHKTGQVQRNFVGSAPDKLFHNQLAYTSNEPGAILKPMDVTNKTYSPACNFTIKCCAQVLDGDIAGDVDL